jgi:hypothetical protein
MFNNIINVAKTASAFLQNGKAPPNTPEYLQRKMKETNHLASKKFFVIFTSVIMLAAFYYSSVFILLAMKMPEHIPAFVTLFSKTIEIFAIIIASYLGVEAVVDLRYNSASNAEVKGEVIVEKIEETVTHNTKEDDYDISEVSV